MTRAIMFGLAATVLLVPAIAPAGIVISEMQVSVTVVGEPEYAVGYLVLIGAPPEAKPITLAETLTAPQLSPIPQPAPR